MRLQWHRTSIGYAADGETNSYTIQFDGVAMWNVEKWRDGVFKRRDRVMTLIGAEARAQRWENE